jgi:hypothetical protein
MKGITWNKRRSRYRVQVRINGRVANFGEYILLDEALEVRDVALWAATDGDWQLPKDVDVDALNDQYHSLIEKVYEYRDQEPASQAKDPEDRRVRVDNPVVKDLIEKVDDLTLKLSLAAGKLHAHEQALEKAGLL